MIVRLENLQKTEQLATRIASLASHPITIALNGSLGTGKTQFVRYFVAAVQSQAPDQMVPEVTSPTYVLLQRYATRPEIFHFDFYRLTSQEEVWDLGIDELFEQTAWVLIEWANKFPGCMPDDYLEINLSHAEDDCRTAQFVASGKSAENLLCELAREFQS